MGNILKCIAVITLLTTSLSSAQHRIDNRLKPYVQEYFDLLDANDIKYDTPTILIRVAQPFKGIDYLGIALGMNDDTLVYIKISPRFFDLDRNTRRWVMFHELSHDIFNLKHGSIELMNKKVYDYTDFKTLERSKKELIKYLKQ